MTKPDWSDEAALLWIEMKYVRSSSEVTKITDQIGADITKYGDNRRRSLFAVYDPQGYIVDRNAFVADVERHEGNLVRLIR